MLSFDILDKKYLELFGYKLFISQKFLLPSGSEQLKVFLGIHTMEEVMVSCQSKTIIVSLLFGILLIFDISWSRNILAISDNTVSLSILQGYVDEIKFNTW
jgi:hypothetical protein